MAVVTNLKEIRKLHNIPQKDMAFAIGTCPKTICNIERGYYCPTLETALRLAKYLDVSVEQLFVLDESVEAVKPMH